MGRLMRKLKGKEPGGEGAYIRIQNHSTKTVEIKVIEGRNVDDQGQKDIQGTIRPGKQLPTDGKKKFDSGGLYTYLEGDVSNRFQKDGYLRIEAHPNDNTPMSSLELVVDHDSWESRDKTSDESSSIILVADVEEDEDDNCWRMELRIYDNFKGNRWMQELSKSIASKPLCHVGLPGTHDSGTYKFDKDKGASPDSNLTSTIQDKLDRGRLLGKVTDMILETIFTRLCQCQDKPFGEQLNCGIRYLDMRVAYHDDSKQFYTCHGVYCVEMKEAMKEIGDFLKGNPKEIVILEFKGLYNMDGHHDDLCDLVIDAIGEDKVADKDDIKPQSTVQEYWDKGYQAVVLYKDRSVVKKYEGKIWPNQRFISGEWPNTGDPKVLKERLMKTVEEHEPDSDKFLVVQGILTPNEDLIKKELLDGGGLSIKDFSTMCSGKVVGWAEEEWKPKRVLNIVIVDFFENCAILPAIINYNRM